METIINNGQEGTFQSVNISLKIKGWLGHDNKYFDRACLDQQCRGMYNSAEHTACPKCGNALTFITTSKNEPMGVSEGTFYPVLSQKQKEDDLKRAMAKKGGVQKVYRFKMYSFGDGNVLAPPPEHAFCKKGAMVEIHIVNHQSDLSMFLTKDKTAMVEEMFHIYSKYGDSVKLIQGAKVAETTITYPVNADGSPTPLTMGAAGGNPVEHLRTQLNHIMTALNKLEGNPAADTALVSNAGAVTVDDGEANPFADAS